MEYLLLSPCCLNKANLALMQTTREKKIESYHVWTMELFFRVTKTGCDRSLVQDANVISEKNNFILAFPRFPSRSIGGEEREAEEKETKEEEPKEEPGETKQKEREEVGEEPGEPRMELKEDLKEERGEPEEELSKEDSREESKEEPGETREKAGKEAGEEAREVKEEGGDFKVVPSLVTLIKAAYCPYLAHYSIS
jgi:hypothetical protein